MVVPGLNMHYECSHLDYVGVTFTLYYIRDMVFGCYLWVGIYALQKFILL